MTLRQKHLPGNSTITNSPLMEDFAWDSNKENEDANALGLDQYEIPKDWNFSFITMPTEALQTLHSKIQATIPANPVAYDHLSSVWNIDSSATSHICAYCFMFEEYIKEEQASDVWTRAGLIRAIGTGTVLIKLVCSNSIRTVILLERVLYVPGFLINLVSISRLRAKGVY